MPRFITGDELGNVKIYTMPHLGAGNPAVTCHDIYREGVKAKTIQALAILSQTINETLLSSAHTDGSVSLYSLYKSQQTLSLAKQHEWLESRCKPDQRFVGLAMSERGTYSCTSNGALRLTAVTDAGLQHTVASLPMRLCNWRLSPNQQNFAYGGEEVELSVWDTEKAFSQPQTDNSNSQKRKRDANLLHAEIWRAKNVPNDSLSLRQPVHITSFAYLSASPQSSTGHHHHLITGTQHGHVRRYDTRAARRPISDWGNIAKVGGIKLVEKGFSEHEAFVSDYGSNLFALDARTGRVLYGYQGISGSVTSLAPSPDGLASTSLDRFFRVHSTVPPSSQSDVKGMVLDKVYTKSIPTVVIWDPTHNDHVHLPHDEDEDEGDKVWDEMKHVGDSDEDELPSRDKKSNRIR